MFWCLQDKWFCSVCDRIFSVSTEKDSLEVQHIVDKRVGPRGQVECKVRWTGLLEEHDSWLPSENFSDKYMVATFEQRGTAVVQTSTPGKQDLVPTLCLLPKVVASVCQKRYSLRHTSWQLQICGGLRLTLRHTQHCRWYRANRYEASINRCTESNGATEDCAILEEIPSGAGDGCGCAWSESVAGPTG